MRAGRGLLLVALCFAAPLGAQTVSNVRMHQLADATVEVLYDLAGAGAQGASVTVAFSDDSGGTYAIQPAAAALRGDVGDGIASGSDRRILWNAAATLAPQTCRPTFRASVTARNLAPGTCSGPLTVSLPGGVPLELVCLKAGSFVMGSPDGERERKTDEGPAHPVTLSRDLYVGKYEVTQAQWQAVTGANPSFFKGCGGSCPVEMVSWDAITGSGGFLEKLNQQQGGARFRLPTEAEWEYAARGGTSTPFSFGDDASCSLTDCSACALFDLYAWWCGNNLPHGTKPVGQKRPNGYGLYDVHGNVYEWVQDAYDPGYYGRSPAVDPQGPAGGAFRVIRGGFFVYSARFARSAARDAASQTYSIDGLGLRVVRTP